MQLRPAYLPNVVNERGGTEGRVEGVVAGELDIPFFAVSITTDGEPREFVRTDSFPIETDLGPVEVAVSTLTRLVPEREIRGDFGELLDDPLTQLVMDYAPGDHVHTRITGSLLRKGDRIVAHGLLLHANNLDGSYREAPTRRVQSVLAHVVAIGEDGDLHISDWLADRDKEERGRKKAVALSRRGDQEQQAARRKRQGKQEEELAPVRPPLLVMWIFAFASAALFVLALAQGLPTFYERHHTILSVLSNNPTWLFASSACGLTAYLWRRRRWMPSFLQVGNGGHGHGRRWSVGWQVTLAVLVLSMAILGLDFLGKPVFYVTAALCLYFPIAIIWADQKNANIAFSLARAKPLSSDLPDKRFGRIEGRFEGKLSYSRKHETKSSTQTVTRTDSDGRSFNAQETSVWVEWTEHCSAAGNNRMLADGHEPITLDLSGARWAHAECLISYPAAVNTGLKGFLKFMPAKHGKQIALAERKARPRLESHASNEDSILVAARVRRDEDGSVVFRSSGPSSFTLFSAAAGTSARAALLRHLAAHYLALALAISSVALPLYLVLSW